MPQWRDAPRLVSVVIPAHDEEAGLDATLDVVAEVLDGTGLSWEIVVVDDGSSDATFACVCERSVRDRRIGGVRLSRCFGKEAALLAGLGEARGDVVVTLDADLQHPPQLIPAMLERWRAGVFVVDGVKRTRAHAGVFERVRAALFNAAISRASGTDLRESSDFKLLDRVVVDALVRELPEHGRFFRGLTAWAGFPHESLPFDVAERHDGASKFTLRALVRLATTAVLSFTAAPLRLVTVLGLVTLVLGAVVGGEAIWSWAHGRSVSGFVTTILTLLVVGSFIMISLGIVGEYLAKVYEEVKRRPPYLVAARTRDRKPDASAPAERSERRGDAVAR